MPDFPETAQFLPIKFIPLSSEITEPFVIPNVSPVASPVLQPRTNERADTVRDRVISVVELD